MKYLFLLLTVVLLTGCVEEYKSAPVEGVVIEKDYDAAKTTKKRVKQSDGSYVTKTKRHPAEYDVTIAYTTPENKRIEEEFDNKTFYNSVKEGQKVQVLYRKGYDKEGKLVAEDIKLIESK